MSDFEKDDRGIKVHSSGAIAHMCAPFRSHEQGLPEWFKNATAAYARENVPTENRVITLLFGKRRADDAPYIAVLDHVGMTVQDIEEKFADWGNPQSHLPDIETDEEIPGGHGNGGKCYMTQMFEVSAYLHTVKDGRCSRYGFNGGDPHPGYFPDKARARGIPVSGAKEELTRALDELGVRVASLPDAVLAAIAVRGGFTLVVGIKPKHFAERNAWKVLVEDALINHHQMVQTTETNQIFVMRDGRAVADYAPIRMPEISPHEFAPEPRVVAIPALLKDPVSGQMCETTSQGAPSGQLLLRTSDVSMRRSRKGRHHIRFMSRAHAIAFLKMEDISRSYWVDRMYGECQLDSLRQFETNDRARLAEAPLTRALEDWLKTQVFDYENEFKKRERLESNQDYQLRVQRLNEHLDRWKNRFLEDEQFLAGVGGGEGGGAAKRKKTKRRPLPEIAPSKVKVRCEHSKAGVGVWLRVEVQFLDSNGDRVAPVPFQWFSSDWAVATVDPAEGVVTHSPGRVQLWLETTDRLLRSDPIEMEVLDIKEVKIIPPSIEVAAGSVKSLDARVIDTKGIEHDDVFMTWVQDDSSVLGITSLGRIFGRKAGSTTVSAMDDRAQTVGACHVTVVPAKAGEDDPGKGYPRIVLSEIEPDPLNPDGEPYHMSPEDGPVHQPTPQHVQRNIWFINLQCPLAKLYYEQHGPESVHWRTYHVERYIEALAKIRLSLDYQREEELSFDEIERRWREIAAEVQRLAAEELRELLEGGEVPEE